MFDKQPVQQGKKEQEICCLFILSFFALACKSKQMQPSQLFDDRNNNNIYVSISKLVSAHRE